MSRRVFLHIGAPKTGTTYLQDRLALNAKALSAHGVHVPARNAVTSPGLSHFRAALDLLDQDWGGPPGHAEGAWDALMKRVRRLDGTVVISHEILAPAEPHQIARAKQDLAGAELHIVYTARDQGRQLPAAWQESIKQGRSWTYKRYRRRLQRGTPWFARAFDLPAVLAAWGEGLPPAHVHVITVPHGRSDALWERFAAVVGIDPAWAPKESERLNRSLGVAETAVLRKLNQRLARTSRHSEHDALVRDLLAEGYLVNRDGTRLRMPPRMHPWAVAQAERWIEWLEGSGVDVVGDLAELHPAPPVPRQDYVDPDRIGAKAQLAVALDALALMTSEAARRPDPDDGVTRKVRERWRELRQD